jgi:hypothetical protein
MAKEASNLKLIALRYLADARKARASGDSALYDYFKGLYDSALSTYQDYIDTIQNIISIISPMPLSGNSAIYATITSYQKEWTALAKGIVSDYTTYLPQKILEIITTVISVGLTVPIPVIGNVDIIQFFNDEAYRNTIKAQVGDLLSSISDAISEMYTGLFGGVKSTEMQLHEVWCWVCQQISTGGMKLLHEAFTKLIKEFKSVWDSLGLPSLPALVTLDVEGIILAAISGVLSSYDSLIATAQSAYDSVLALFKNGEASQSDLDSAKETLMTLVKDKWTAVVDSILGLSFFGITLSSLITITGDTATLSSEDIITDLISQAKDFVNNYVLNIFISWMDTVKSFFNAIGLGSLIAMITFDFCDFLDLIGLDLP